MKRIGVLTALVGLMAVSTAMGAEVIQTENFALDVGGRLQVLGFVQRTEDPFRDDNRMYMFLRQARLMMEGKVSGSRYKVTLGFAGEDEARAPSPGVSLGLLDMYFDIPVSPLGENAFVRVGQFKIPYSLERLSDPGRLSFTDRSINNVAFRMGRDLGVALHAQAAGFQGVVGMFTGGGRDVPERYLPLVLGVPLFGARLGYDNGLYGNAYAERPAAAGSGVKYAVFANALYLKDSQVGHSTVLNVRLGERPLLINTNWNPFLTQSPTERGEVWMMGGDAAVRIPVREGQAITGQAEYNYGFYRNAYGTVSLTSARAEAGYAWNQLAGTVRYGLIFPDSRMTSGAAQVTGREPIQEVTPALTWNLMGESMRLVADLPILVNVPVVTENNVGNYVLTEHPDQASLLKTTGTVARQTVLEARLLFQAAF